MTFLSRNTLVRCVDLVLRHASLFILPIGLDQLLLLFGQRCVVTLELSVLGLDVLDVLEVAVDPPERKEESDGYNDAEDGKQYRLYSDLLAERAERNLG